jgi:hypothetical protein
VTPCPTCGSWEEFRTHRFEEALRRPLVRDVLDRRDIARPARLAMTSSVHVVAVSGPVVVKLYQPLSERDALAIESDALRLLRQQGRPVPALLATGELFPTAPRFRWRYCVMTTLAGLDAYGWGDLGRGWSRRMLALSLAHDFDEVGALIQRAGPWRTVASLDDLAVRLWDF